MTIFGSCLSRIYLFEYNDFDVDRYSGRSHLVLNYLSFRDLLTVSLIANNYHV
jgi:hypothetical protein